jgi:hypothetical protein
MFVSQNILGSSRQAIQEQAIMEAKNLEELRIKKEQQVLQSKLNELDSKISNLEGKSVSSASTIASTPAPAKSMTLMHIGLLAGGLVGGYLIFKFMNK